MSPSTSEVTCAAAWEPSSRTWTTTFESSRWPRFRTGGSSDEPAEGGPDEVAVTVSLLFSPLELGAYSPEEVALRVRQGRHALMVYQNNRVGLLLPFVAVTNNLDRSEFIAEVIDKAGITRPPYYWCRFECASWLADAQGISLLDGGFPRRPEPVPFAACVDKLATLHVKYLVRQQEADGSLYFCYEPFQDRLHQGISAPRLAHAAWVLARACNVLGGPELEDARDRIIDYHLNAGATGRGRLLAGERRPSRPRFQKAHS